MAKPKWKRNQFLKEQWFSLKIRQRKGLKRDKNLSEYCNLLFMVSSLHTQSSFDAKIR